MEQMLRRIYDNEVVYVRGLKDEDVPLTNGVAPAAPSDAPTAAQTSKRPRLCPALLPSERRSGRHRKKPGERQVTVSSTDTLRSLKIQLIEHFQASPVDQHVYSDGGQELVDMEATLGSLNVLPGDVLYLKCDVAPPLGGAAELLDDGSAQRPPVQEKGFKGTHLVSLS